MTLLSRSKIFVSFIVIILLFVFFAFLPAVFAQQKTLKLSIDGQRGINTLARNILTDGINPRITTLRTQLDPQDYATVKTIGLLPDSPWYFLKSVGRGIRLFFIFDQAGKTYQLLKDGNEKTLEALLMVEKAAQEKDVKKQDQLTVVSANILNSVGGDFDSVAKTLDSFKKTDTIQAYLLQEEAFQFAGYYLKHQILLQKQQDRLNENDFLLIEAARVKHLGSIAHIVVSESRDPVLFGQQLSQLLSSEVGSNNTQLATIAVLRDLENNASANEIPQLQNAQGVLQKELDVKLGKLSKPERLKQIKKYLVFVHGNPIREFQAFNFLSRTFASQEMGVLTKALKDAAAQDFKKHLSVLDSPELQKLFVATVFSRYPVDLRLLAYTEIQLENDKNTKQLEQLKAIKDLLELQICQTYGKSPKALIQTRFYSEATTAPTLLDIRVGQFINQSMQGCSDKVPETLTTVSDLQAKIIAGFTAETKTIIFSNLPTKQKAEEVLKAENISVSQADEQKVAEEVIEETGQIEEEISENPAILEKEVLTIVEKTTSSPKETVIDQTETISNEEKTIVEEIIQSGEPTTGEVTVKEEQIIEEIVDMAETGETSPYVSDLPPAVQEEIVQETNTTLPPPAPTPVPEPVVTPVQQTTETTASEPTPTADSTEVAPGL